MQIAEVVERLLIVSTGLLIGGTFLTLALFAFNVRSFVDSPLFIKILLWLPLLAVFIGALYWPGSFGVAVIIAIVAGGTYEAIRIAATHDKRLVVAIYWLLFTGAFGHFIVLGAPHVLVAICLGSVMSDVTAFFFGMYFGRHKLPPQFNSKKSWEGVAGQVIGALLGVLLTQAFIIPVPSFWLFVPIGIGSAMGDLANSYAKRKLGIKDWGNSIPGHGGFLDRFASLAGAALLSAYCLPWM